MFVGPPGEGSKERQLDGGECQHYPVTFQRTKPKDMSGRHHLCYPTLSPYYSPCFTDLVVCFVVLAISCPVCFTSLADCCARSPRVLPVSFTLEAACCV